MTIGRYNCEIIEGYEGFFLSIIGIYGHDKIYKQFGLSFEDIIYRDKSIDYGVFPFHKTKEDLQKTIKMLKNMEKPFTIEEAKEMIETNIKSLVNLAIKHYPELKDKNAFVKEFSLFDSKIEEISEYLFGNAVLMYPSEENTSKINRPDLKNKSLFFKDSLKLILHDVEGIGTILEVQKNEK